MPFNHGLPAHRNAISLLTLTATLIAPIAQPQTPLPAPNPPAPPSLTFEVISIKQNKTPQGYREVTIHDGYSAVSLPFTVLLYKAYGIPTAYYHTIGAPSWSDNTFYDIQAKVAEADIPAFEKLDYSQRMAMLQQILTDRFKVKIHWETRTEPVFSLVVVKPGVLTETSPSDDKPTEKMGGSRGYGTGALAGQMVARVHTMPWLARVLSGTDGRMVIDNTGLTGHYTADLHWTANPTPSPNSDPDGSISLYTALQEQLGLKLVPAKGPVQCLVVDHVELPSEN
jgi:uncharacterized protein (TIGR03435 family)